MHSDQRFHWGGAELPISEGSKHFFVMGATGSGKTITIRLLMQEVLPLVGARVDGELLDHRAVIYDAKQEMLSYLYGMQIDRERIRVINPFYAQGCAWDMAADVTAPATAQEIAAILIPEEKNSTQPFFTNAARHLLYGVLMAFITKKKKTGQHWTFRDVVLAMRSESWMRQLFEQPECKAHTGHLVEMYLNPGDTLNSVKATIATKMMPYEVVASAWSFAAKERPMISLREFLDPTKERLILILGNDEENREAVNAINRVLFKRLTELILGQRNSNERRTWVFLDEVREAGKMDGLNSLLLRGRSKGACVVLGFQDIYGLWDVYGQYQAQELVGQCAHKAIFRLESPTTAEWAARHFGTVERIVSRKSQSDTIGHGRQQNVGTRDELEKSEIVLPIQLLDIAPVHPKHKQITGYYLTPLGRFTETIRFGNSTHDPQPDSTLPYFHLAEPDPQGEFERRHEDQQYLPVWTPTELKKHGLKHVPKRQSRSDTPPPQDAEPPVDLDL